jgi:hypothetical protein
MYKYTEQATIQWAIPGLLRGPANAPNNRAPTRLIETDFGCVAAGSMAAHNG